MYEVKGAGDYVESANTVLLMELAKQTRGAGGKFGTQSAEDRVSTLLQGQRFTR